MVGTIDYDVVLSAAVLVLLCASIWTCRVRHTRVRDQVRLEKEGAEASAAPPFTKSVNSAMDDKRFEIIAKSLSDRVLELMQSLQVIRDSIAQVHAGKMYQLIPLHGQLRALLTEKAKKNDPLLLEIAAALGEELRFFAMPGPSGADVRGAVGQAEMFVHLAGFPIGLHQSFEAQTAVTMEEFLDKPLLIYRERNYTARYIIDLFATKAGGSHYAGKLTRDDAELLSLDFVGMRPLANALLQLAEVTFALGQRLLRRLCKFEFHLLLFIPRQKLRKPAVLLDSKYPNTSIRFTVLLQPGMKLSFHVGGLDGASGFVVNERSIEWPGPRYVLISSDLSEDLRTVLRVTVDGEEVASNTLPSPFFIPNVLRDYDIFWNRSHEDEQSGAKFGLSEVAATGGEQSGIDRARLLLYFDEQCRQAQKFIFYIPGTYGRSPPGIGDVQMSDGVVMRFIDSLKAEYPS